ncbi:hypothetical protein EDD11_009861 [Mortierella claussenii]|nr:hypothetical protein EDD11_009861 [Mortierella claussenii]
MVGKLFNDLVTTLDIIPASSTVDVCVQHPSTCALSGKVRIIAKRPCVYKSLVLTVTGITRVWHRQGSRTMKAKQVFLNVSKDIVYHNQSSMMETELQPDQQQQQQQQQQQPRVRSSSVSSGVFSTTEAALSAISQNQLDQGVNDIDFRIEFPSHMSINDLMPPSPSTEEENDPLQTLCHLPSGPTKTTVGDSSIVYTLQATLVMSRRDILVNNHMSMSIPFRVQSWQDSLESDSGRRRRQSEDHAYHGKRRGKVEFQFEVPKQLDLRRLQDLQFGFQASWRTLQDRLRVKQIQYFIIEEEQQSFASRTGPVVNTSIISTSATHDCTAYNVETNNWGHLRAAARLQIPQPNMVIETTTLPYPHSLSVSHKLRVLIKFDPALAKERDLQLSFPIVIHPTLNLDGSPVHPDLNYDHRPSSNGRRNRRRTSRALYGIEYRHGDGDGDSEDDEFPLPMYADREETLLLMVGEEVHQEAGLHIDALDISMSMSHPEPIAPYSPSEASIMSSLHSGSPSSPISRDTFPFPISASSVNAPIQGEQHAWSILNRSVSLTPSSAAHPSHFSLLSSSPVAAAGTVTSRRHSSFEYASERFLPPPYVLPTLSEEPSMTTRVEQEEDHSSLGQGDAGAFSGTEMAAGPRPLAEDDDLVEQGDNNDDLHDRRGHVLNGGKGKGKGREIEGEGMLTSPEASSSSSHGNVFSASDFISSDFSSSSASVAAAAAAEIASIGSSSFRQSRGLLTPSYEIREELRRSYPEDIGDPLSSSSYSSSSLSSSSSSSSPSMPSSSSSESDSEDQSKRTSYVRRLLAQSSHDGRGSGFAYSYSFASAY